MLLLFLCLPPPRTPARDLNRASVSDFATFQLFTSLQHSSAHCHIRVLVVLDPPHHVFDLVVCQIHLHRGRFGSVHPDEYLDHVPLPPVPCHDCPIRHVLLDLSFPFLLFPFPFLTSSSFIVSSLLFLFPLVLLRSLFLPFVVGLPVEWIAVGCCANAAAAQLVQ